jgi:DNA-binding GntR family transcriptional regulator
VETELAAELGISRIPLREAMHQLMGEGLLDYVPNRGFVVTKMTPSEVAELAELCGLIESHLLEAAVPNLRRGHLEEANHWVVQMDLIADPMEWFQVNWQFHSVLYSAAQRPLQLAQVRTLRARGDRYVALLAADPGLRQGLNLEHREILAACEAGDGPTAVATIERHLQGGRREVSRILEERRGGDSEPLG